MIMYLIDTPPPTISGTLHIGHIFSYTQGDIIARYQKYMGKSLLYPFCFDNNGIPTSKFAFSQGITDTKNIINLSLMKSSDYYDTFNSCGIKFSGGTYHTFNNLSIETCYNAFEILKNKGLAYKKESEFLYSEKLKCSISQSELDDNGLIERTGEVPVVKSGIGWFVDIKSRLHDIKSKVNEINWFPPIKFKNRILDWINKVEWDWSISRERHFGIPIPNESNMTFDTWFISALTPQLAWGAHIGNSTIECPVFDMRFQSHDIIRTWAFYTIAMSLFLNNQIPWKNLIVTGHVLDGKGGKLSKSLGNATQINPLLNKHKIAGIRHWASSGALGNDTKIDEIKMRAGGRIKNKFENAKRYVNMQSSFSEEDSDLYDEWMKDKKDILNNFENFNLVEANNLIYKFLWNKFCDVWIEQSKQKSASITLKKIIDEFEPIFNIIYGE